MTSDPAPRLAELLHELLCADGGSPDEACRLRAGTLAAAGVRVVPAGSVVVDSAALRRGLDAADLAEAIEVLRRSESDLPYRTTWSTPRIHTTDERAASMLAAFERDPH